MLKGLTIVFDIYACKSWQGFKPDSAYTLGLGSRNLLDMLKLFFLKQTKTTQPKNKNPHL